VGFDVLTTCQPSTVWCSRERLPAAAAQPAKVRQSCSATDFFFVLTFFAVHQNITSVACSIHAMTPSGFRCNSFDPVYTADCIKMATFWDIAPCRLEK
jgi:hypothetical protein